MHYVKRGQGKKTILFIHGLFDSHKSFQEISTLLEKEFTIYAVDLLGFGYSARPAEPSYDLEFHSQSVIELIDKLDLKNLIIAGNSLGGAIAVMASLARGQRIDKIVLLNPFTEISQSEPRYSLFRQPGMGEILASFLGKGGIKDHLGKYFFHSAEALTDSMLDDFVLFLKFDGSLEAGLKTFRSLEPGRLKGVLSKLNQKTLIIWGKNDKVFLPGDLHLLKEKTKDKPQILKLVELESCGHFPQREKPVTVARLINDF